MRPCIGAILVMCALLCLAGCGLLDDDHRELRALDSDVGFLIERGFDSPAYYLKMRTDEVYPCCNWQLVASISERSREIRVSFRGIEVPDVCLTAIGPARRYTRLSLRPGAYRLQLDARDRHDSYEVAVSDSGVTITPVTSTFTHVLDSL